LSTENVWMDEGKPAFAHAAGELVGEYFIACNEKGGAVVLYPILDRDNHIVGQPIRKPYQLEQIGRAVAGALRLVGLIVNRRLAGKLRFYFVAYGERSPSPVRLGQQGGSEWCFERATTPKLAAPELFEFVDPYADEKRVHPQH